MSEKIKNIVGQVKNPLTGKSLGEEGRMPDCREKDGQLHITYARDGIDSTSKRKIEDAIVMALGNLYPPDNILVKTVSKDSRDIPGHAPSQAEANLKTGHGTISQKKRIPDVHTVLAVSSCKGGVGKSTVAVNLATSLKNRGKSVGILDADIYGPSLPTLLGQEDAKPKATENKKIEPIDAHGLKFISFGLFIPKTGPVIWRGPMLGGVLNQFLFDVKWGKLDYLLVDLPPGTGDIQLSLIQNTQVDGAIVISTPQNVALNDTKKGLNMFKNMKVPVVGMIENMSYFAPDDDLQKKYFIFGKGGVEKAAQELGVPFLGCIPLETVMQESCDLGSPYMHQHHFKGRPAWNSYMEISKKIDTLLNKAEEKGFFGKIFG